MRTRINKYVGPHYCTAVMYAGRVACCPLLSHDEYANRKDKQTDERQTVTLRFPLDTASVTNCYRIL